MTGYLLEKTKSLGQKEVGVIPKHSQHKYGSGICQAYFCGEMQVFTNSS